MNFRLILVLCMALALALAPPAVAMTAEEAIERFGINSDAQYSASRVVTAEGESMRFKEFRKGESMRLEIDAQGMQTVMIAHNGQGYAVMPAMSAYIQTDLSDVMGRTGWNQELQFTSIEEVGDESVGGVDATRYHVKHSEPGNEGEGDFWVTDDGVLIKVVMDAKDGNKVRHVESHLEDLVMAPQSEELFLVPAGYTAIKTGGLFGGASQSPAPAAATPGDAAEPADAPTNGEQPAQGTAGALRDAFQKLIPKGSQ